MKDNLIKMQKISDLMLTLSYNALFLNDKKLSKIVNDLYDEIIHLEKSTLKLILLAKIKDEEAYQLINLIEYIRDYANASKNIINLMDGDSQLLKKIISNTEDKVTYGYVNDNSIIAGMKLKESRVRSNTGVNIISVRRGKKWFFKITSDFTIRKGDLLIFECNNESEKLFRKILG